MIKSPSVSTGKVKVDLSTNTGVYVAMPLPKHHYTELAK